ncbi:hypothetical protein SRO_0496 [Streptomyces rochei]|nr:hypothetical protein SRO_0496 [Streptomyces rochei]
MVQLTPDFFAVPVCVVCVAPRPEADADAGADTEELGRVVLVAVDDAAEEGEALSEARSEPLPPQAVSERPRATPATASIEIFWTRISSPWGRVPLPVSGPCADQDRGSAAPVARHPPLRHSCDIRGRYTYQRAGTETEQSPRQALVSAPSAPSGSLFPVNGEGHRPGAGNEERCPEWLIGDR